MSCNSHIKFSDEGETHKSCANITKCLKNYTLLLVVFGKVISHRPMLCFVVVVIAIVIVVVGVCFQHKMFN